MSKFIIKFEIPSRRTYGITCTSEPLPQWELADFIQSLTDSNYTLLGVSTVEDVEPEAERATYEDEEDEEELYPEDIEEMDWEENEEDLYMEEMPIED